MIKIGTSGFSFPDWKGTVYPGRISTAGMLSYYVGELGFKAVEINSTYYSIPKPGSMEAMAKKTPGGFEFTVKAYKGMTHDPFDNRMKDGYRAEHTEDDFRLFREAVAPLADKGKLGAVLLQFPVFFYPSAANREYILRSRELLEGLPMVVEFRNSAWAEESTFIFLKENELAYCAVDEPKISRLMPFINRVTAGIGYLRFHGRNENWFNAPVSKRYDYLYTAEELEEFVPEAGKMEKQTEKTFIFFNNCHGGSAAKNAAMFMQMLGLDSAGSFGLFR